MGFPKISNPDTTLISTSNKLFLLKKNKDKESTKRKIYKKKKKKEIGKKERGV